MHYFSLLQRFKACFILLPCLLLHCFYAFGQQFQWVTTAGSGYSGGEHAEVVSTDLHKNVYVSGEIEGFSSEFVPGIIFEEGVFIAKYNAVGQLQWTKGFGKDNTYVKAIETDSKGNVYVAGSSRQGFILEGFIFQSSSHQDLAYIIKFDPEGKVLWVNRLGCTAWDHESFINSLVIDQHDQLYVTGSITGDGDFGPEPIKSRRTLTGYPSSDMFIAKCSPEGSIVWVKQAGGSLDDQGLSIAIDKSRNALYVCGNANEQDLHFGNLPYQPANMQEGGFIARYDYQGNLLWVNSNQGNNGITIPQLAVVPNGNVYILGKAMPGEYNFDAQTLLIESQPGIFDYSSIFIACINAEGHFQWTKKLADYSMYLTDWRLITDSKGQLYVSGIYRRDQKLGPFTAAGTLNEEGSYSINSFVAKLNEIGYPQWMKFLPGSSSEEIRGICLTKEEKILLVGYFSAYEYKFDDIQVRNSSYYSQMPDMDVFVAALSNPTVNLCPAEQLSLVAPTIFCQGDSVRLVAEGNDGVHWSWMKDNVLLKTRNQSTIWIKEGGTYHVIVNATTPCADTSNAVFIQQSLIPTNGLTLQKVLNPCGEETFIISAERNPSCQYQWFYNDQELTGQTADTLIAKKPGQYWVQITTPNACSILSEVEEVFITTTQEKLPLFLNHSPYLCEGESVTISVEKNPSYRYQWYRNDQVLTAQTQSSLQINESGRYQVQIKIYDICTVYSDIKEIFTLPGKKNILPDSVVVCPEIPLMLSSNLNNFNGSYLWSTGEQTSQITVTKPGSYWLKLNEHGCESFEEVRVVSTPSLFIPNILTPNGDGKNDYFIIQNLLSTAKLEVYNRFGRLVYRDENYQNDWQAQGLINGVYFYQLENFSSCSQLKIAKGWIQVLR